MSDHAEHHGPSYITIWYILIGLLGLGLLGMGIGNKYLAIGFIFLIAIVKAILVGRYYMHLKTEASIVYVIFFVPVLLLFVLAFLLVPDIIYRPS
jgi:caa(3)-type oxidase subunit IV